MPLRHFLSAVTRNFAELCMHRHGHHGKRSAFISCRDADLTIKVSDSWDGVRDRLPIGWQSDFHLAHSTVPACLRSVSIPKVARAADSHLFWHHYFGRLERCDGVLADVPTAEVMAHHGI